MKTRYFNWPVYIGPEEYERAISLVLKSLTEQKELVGLFQIGSVSDPGISDIDLVALYEDDYATLQDPLAVLDKKQKYLFPHGVFAISRSHFQEYRRFLIHFKFRKLYGKMDELNPILSLTPEEESILKNQIAIEFIFLNYMKKEIESAYKMVDVRSTLLSAKAILFDLDFLGMNDNELARLIKQLAVWRKNWFIAAPKARDFNNWNNEFISSLRSVITDFLKGRNFFLPNENDSIHYANHIQINRAEFVLPKRTGIAFASPLMAIGKKYFRLLNRLNHFTFTLPWKYQGIPNILVERISCMRELKNLQKLNYPLFSPLLGNIQNIIE